MVEMYLWDNYNPGEINEKIKYWIDLWDDLINNFNKKSYGLKLINPQLLIKDIIDEIEFNDFQNTENKKYFYNKLNELLKDDPVIKEYFQTEFNLIRRNFNDNKFYIKQLCKECQYIFESGEYFKKAFFRMKQIFLNPTWEENNQKDILILSQHLIIDFILKGYDIKTVQKFPKKIFDKYYLKDKKYIETDFPHEIDIVNYKVDDDYDLESYTKAIKAKIDGLTIEDRLDRFINFFYVETKDVYYIFEIEGLKGDIDISIGSVNFYSPKIKKYVKTGMVTDEFFSENEEQYFLNAAVKINTIDSYEDSNRAIEEIEKALDILKVFYNTESKLEIASENYLVVDMEGKQIFSKNSVSYRKGFFRWHNSLDLKEHEPKDWLRDIFNNCSSYIFTSIDKQSIIENRISHSLHWFRKGTEANSSEDKLVNYWVVIENLLDFKISLQDSIIPKNQKETKFSLARELIPPIIISEYIYNVGWELYCYLVELLNSGQGERKYLDLPKNIINDCNLAAQNGDEINLHIFINNLPKLLPYINRKIIKDKIIYTNKFYSDPVFCKEQINKNINDIKDDVVLVYRYRNKIVHNAHYDDIILPYYVRKVRNYSSLILRRIVSNYNINSKPILEELFVKHYIKVNELIEKLNNNIKVDLFEVKL